MELLHKELTDKILASFFAVQMELGHGFLEKVYQNSMYLELKAQGLQVIPHLPIKVYYKGHIVGDYFPDLLVENKVILELKAAVSIHYEHELQLLNYLKATEYELGYLLNFGKKGEFKRIIYTNDNKKLKRN
jgi:GxxExxY protein